MKDINEFIVEKLNQIDWTKIKLTEKDKKNIHSFSYDKSDELVGLDTTIDWVWKLKEKPYNDLNERVDSWLSQLGIDKKTVKQVEHLPKDANERYINSVVIRKLAISQKL